MSQTRVRQLGTELAAGAITASVALPLCIAAGVLTYTTLPGSHAADGTVAGIVSAVAGGIAAALARRSSFVTTIPTNPNALIQSSVLASLLVLFGGATHQALVGLAACALVAGLLQAALGVTGLARIVKLAPHTVIAGFVSGVGILIVKSQLPMLLGAASFAALVAEGPGPGAATRLPFALGLVAWMFVLPRRAPQIPPLLAGLITGLGGYHALHLVAPGLDLGPVVGAVSLVDWSPPNPADVVAVLASTDPERWRILLGGAATLALVGTLDTVFTLRAARNMADIPVDESRDLVGQGIANVLAATTGGLFVSTSMSLSAANFQAGGRSRLSTAAAGLFLLGGIWLFPTVVGSLPLLVLSSILVVVGINVVDKWAVRICRRAVAAGPSAGRAQAWRNAAIVLTVAFATLVGQPIVGAAVGVLLACVVFMIEMNRPVVRRRDVVGELRSKRIRSAAESESLRARGGDRAVLELDGVLFFGNADRLATEIERDHQGARVVVLDFTHVRSIDASGAVTLEQIATRLAKAHRQLVLSGLREVSALLGAGPALAAVASFPNLDLALEHAEYALVADAAGQAEGPAELALEDTDFGRTMAADDLGSLARHMERREFARGVLLGRAGDRSDRLWVLTRGSIGIWLEGTDGRRRLASIGAGCVVGEMGLLNHLPRSADVRAEEDVVAWELTTEAFGRLMEQSPSIARALLTSIAHQLAERLRVTSEDLRVATS